MSESNKRKVVRAEVATRCPGAVHTDDGGSVKGMLRNVSTAGAKLDLDDELEAEVGAQVRLELTTPYGGCACEARLAWMRDGAIGLEFTELPVDEADPLNRFVHAPGVLHWLWRTFWDVDDRRRAARAYLTTFCPVTFAFDGAEHSGSMRNLSDGGALLQITGVDAFPPGTELDLAIQTPYGESSCRAQVMWTDHTDEEAFLAGVQFVDLVAGQSEPLRALMDAPF